MQSVAPVPRCLLCDGPALRANLCRGCLGTLPVIGMACGRCGAPTAAAAAGCVHCPGAELPWQGAASAFRYAFPVDFLLKRLKFDGRLEAARALGEAAAVVFAHRRPARIDAVVPVPLHWRREWRRGFNQADELLRPICRALDLPLAPGLLRRPVATRVQSRLDEPARAANLRDAFRVRGTLRGARIVLFDDVMTTGATARAAAAALVGAGARDVLVWTCARAARTVRPWECGSSGPRRSCPDPR